MVTILEDNPSFARSFARNLGGGIGQGLNKSVDFAQQMALQKQQQQAQQLGKGQQGPDFSGALNALSTLESMIEQPGIGLIGKLNPSDKARYNRGQFEATTAALLPLFKAMFPRGMTEKEFKYIQENYIPQAGDTEAKIKGKISGLRLLLGNNLPGMMGQENPMQMQGQQQTKERPPLSSFVR